jgi:glycosyltransferase involved in cell wall biosynthesis
MHVLYLITQQDRGGAQKYVLELSRQFKGDAAAGPEGMYLAEALASQSLTFYPLPHLRRALRPLWDTRALWEIIKLIKKIKPDILHTNSSKAGVLGSLAGLLTRTPVVFTAHGFQYLEPMSALSKLFFRSVETLCRPLRDFVITVSERDRQKAIRDKVINEKYSKTIYHGIPAPTLTTKQDARAELHLTETDFVIGTIANSYYTKGLDVLITAFANIPDKNIHVVIIGDGPKTPELISLAKKLGVASRTTFAGQIKDAASLLSAFDIFALPSRKEGFPYALLEAMHAGLPIVATKVGGVPEALSSAGVLVDPESPEALSSALTNLIHDSAARETLGSLAKKRAGKFTMARMFAETEAIYHSVLRT